MRSERILRGFPHENHIALPFRGPSNGETALSAPAVSFYKIKRDHCQFCKIVFSASSEFLAPDEAELTITPFSLNERSNPSLLPAQESPIARTVLDGVVPKSGHNKIGYEALTKPGTQAVRTGAWNQFIVSRDDDSCGSCHLGRISP